MLHRGTWTWNFEPKPDVYHRNSQTNKHTFNVMLIHNLELVERPMQISLYCLWEVLNSPKLCAYCRPFSSEYQICREFVCTHKMRSNLSMHHFEFMTFTWVFFWLYCYWSHFWMRYSLLQYTGKYLQVEVFKVLQQVYIRGKMYSYPKVEHNY